MQSGAIVGARACSARTLALHDLPHSHEIKEG
jgi:hypothetical protein